MGEQTQNSNDVGNHGDLATTPDGARTRINELNTGVKVVAGDDHADDSQDEMGRPIGRLRRLWRNLNLVMAGMYTGLGCYGTPHERHSYRQDSGDTADKPDNRTL